MANRAHIGSVHIKVIPDIKDFRRKTEDGLDSKKPFTVPVEPEFDNKRIKDQWDKEVERLGRDSKVRMPPDFESALAGSSRLKQELKALQRDHATYCELN